MSQDLQRHLARGTPAAMGGLAASGLPAAVASGSGAAAPHTGAATNGPGAPATASGAGYGHGVAAGGGATEVGGGVTPMASVAGPQGAATHRPSASGGGGSGGGGRRPGGGPPGDEPGDPGDSGDPGGSSDGHGGYSSGDDGPGDHRRGNGPRQHSQRDQQRSRGPSDWHSGGSFQAGGTQVKKEFSATAPKLGVTDRGLTRVRNLELARVYLCAQMQNNRHGSTAASVSQHLASCFDADLSARYMRVRDDVERYLGRKLNLASRYQVIAADRIDDAARYATRVVKRDVYRMERDYERVIVERMRQGQCTDGCTGISQEETPGQFIDRFVLLAGTHEVVTQLSVRTMINILSKGFHPVLSALWAARRASPKMLEVDDRGDHRTFFKMLGQEARLLDDEWGRYTSGDAPPPAPFGSAQPDQQAGRPQTGAHTRRTSRPGATAAASLDSGADPDGSEGSVPDHLSQTLNAFTAALNAWQARIEASEHAAAASLAGASRKQAILQSNAQAASGQQPPPSTPGSAPSLAPGGQAAPAPQPGLPPRRFGGGGGKCYRCGGVGHRAAQCATPADFVHVAAGEYDGGEEDGEVAIAPAPAYEGEHAHSTWVEEEEVFHECDPGVTAAAACPTADAPAVATATYNGQRLPHSFGAPARPADHQGGSSSSSAAATDGTPSEAVLSRLLRQLLQDDTEVDLGPATLQALQRADAAALGEILAHSRATIRLSHLLEAFRSRAASLLDIVPLSPALLARPAAGAGGEVTLEEGASAAPIKKGGVRRVSFAAVAGTPIDPGEAATGMEAVTLTTERAREVAHDLDRHTDTARGLFFHKQDREADGVQLVLDAEQGRATRVMPPRVLDDSGASCNLMADSYARQVGAKRVAVRSALNGSVGEPCPITEAVWADVVVAAGTPYQGIARRQLFYIAQNDKLYDVLIGNEPTRFGPLESNVDGRDHRYYYTTELGQRHSLPMVAKSKARGRTPVTASVASSSSFYTFDHSGAVDAPPLVF